MTKLIWLSDLHLVDPGHDWQQGVAPLRRLRSFLNEVREKYSDADRIVISGDTIQFNNPGAYSILRRELK